MATASGNGSARRTSWLTPAGRTRRDRSASARDRGFAAAQRLVWSSAIWAAAAWSAGTAIGSVCPEGIGGASGRGAGIGGAGPALLRRRGRRGEVEPSGGRAGPDHAGEHARLRTQVASVWPLNRGEYRPDPGNEFGQRRRWLAAGDEQGLACDKGEDRQRPTQRARRLPLLLVGQGGSRREIVLGIHDHGGHERRGSGGARGLHVAGHRPPKQAGRTGDSAAVAGRAEQMRQPVGRAAVETGDVPLGGEREFRPGGGERCQGGGGGGVVESAVGGDPPERVAVIRREVHRVHRDRPERGGG